MIRPHPAFWRGFHGLNLWYILIFTVLLIVPCEDGMWLIRTAFPEVEVTKNIGFDHLTCAITWENVRRQLVSLWFTAHVVGWFSKMILFRDLTMCILFSTAFEFMELSLQFVVPEFQECWWDSLIIDWALSNVAGMVLGGMTLRYLKTK